MNSLSTPWYCLFLTSWTCFPGLLAFRFRCFFPCENNREPSPTSHPKPKPYLLLFLFKELLLTHHPEIIEVIRVSIKLQPILPIISVGGELVQIRRRRTFPNKYSQVTILREPHDLHIDFLKGNRESSAVENLLIFFTGTLEMILETKFLHFH